MLPNVVSLRRIAILQAPNCYEKVSPKLRTPRTGSGKSLPKTTEKGEREGLEKYADGTAQSEKIMSNEVTNIYSNQGETDGLCEEYSEDEDISEEEELAFYAGIKAIESVLEIAHAGQPENNLRIEKAFETVEVTE